MNELGDLWFVGIADDAGNAGETSDVLRGALGVTTSDNDARGRIGRVDLADGVAGLSVGCSSDGASIENDHVGRRAIGRGGAALVAQLALDGGAIGLRGATAKLFDIEGGHVVRRKGIFKHIRLVWDRRTYRREGNRARSTSSTELSVIRKRLVGIGLGRGKNRRSRTASEGGPYTAPEHPRRKAGRNANSIRRGNNRNVAAFLELIAEVVTQADHRLFHIVVKESGCRDGGEEKSEPAQPEGMAMELLESQPDEKEMREIDAARIAGDVFKDLAEHGSGDFAELRKPEAESKASPP